MLGEPLQGEMPLEKESEKEMGDMKDMINDDRPEDEYVPRRKKMYPKPTVEEPDFEEIENMVFDSIAEATDGCQVEPDGICPHGHPSWLIRLGLI